MSGRSPPASAQGISSGASAQACSISVPAVVPAIAVPAFLCTSAPMIPGDRGLSGADSLKLKDGSR